MLAVAGGRVSVFILLLSSIGTISTSEMRIHHSICPESSGPLSSLEAVTSQAYWNPHDLKITFPPKPCSTPCSVISKTIISLSSAKCPIDPGKYNFSSG